MKSKCCPTQDPMPGQQPSSFLQRGDLGLAEGGTSRDVTLQFLRFTQEAPPWSLASLILALSSLAVCAAPGLSAPSHLMSPCLSPQCFSETDLPEASLNVKTSEVSWLHLSCRKGGWDGPGAPRGPSPLAAFGL